MTRTMRPTIRTFPPALALAASLLLGSCGDGGDNAVDGLDRSLVSSANETDPAMTAALEDQIMVDPGLVAQSNDKSVRPTDGPAQAPIPPSAGPGGRSPSIPTGALLRTPPAEPVSENPTLGELASAQRAAARGNGGKCFSRLRYSMAWADRLPADIALYPDARVTEAAGTDDDGCRVRIVTFTTRAALDRVMDWYYTRALHAGFDSTHQVDGSEHALAGSKDAAAYMLSFRPLTQGTEIDLVVNFGL